MNRFSYIVFAALFMILTASAQGENTPHVHDGLPVKCGTPHVLENLANGVAKTTGFSDYRSTGMDHDIVSSGGHFRVHYNTTGEDAIDLTDIDGNTIPDYVDSCLIYLEYAYDKLMGIGFEPPLSDFGVGGGDETDVYLVDLATDTSGYFGLTSTAFENWAQKSASAYMEIENDFTEAVFQTSGYEALKVTTAHEFFHAVQFRYNYDYSINWWQEQSAVWMEEYAWGEVNDYHNYLKYFFNNYIQSMGYSPRNSPLDTRNGAFEYGAGIFPMYLAKKHGPEIIYDIWQHMGDRNSYRIAEFNAVIPGGLNAALNEFAVWNYFTNDRGNGDDFYPDSPEFPSKILVDGSTSKITGTGSYPTSRLTSKYQEIILSGSFSESDILRVSFSSTDGSFANAMVLYNSPSDYRIQMFEYPSEDVPLEGNWQKALLMSVCTNTTGGDYTYTYQTSVITAVDETAPLAFSLDGVYPNPFNPSTTVVFTVPDVGGMVAVRAHNALGQEVASLYDGHLTGGEKRLLWKPDGNLAGGIYFIRVTGPWGVETTKTLFLK